ncbi:helix-turn-helix domain-containing protein [Tsukamurella sp. 8F]|uniref:winged helix-turn-helix transcriptional regulator n=1 Tax=unclassified Tsukamurella TaxID=2633480 RepID=UPI0023B9284E|nr:MULTISPECIES: helix-turn-helix domain-containing protein [unclassified Tsukamurella]MDF0529363.1 helix-turn-helix domain-containing protein [Tsukamurella sp. 8J]MDF0587130.1 helix-turn-helix domain-containing protein [Tsukamurella sp. 8F]
MTSDYCGHTVQDIAGLIGGKWTMQILWELRGADCRYAELQRRVPGISQKVLSSELKSLVRAGLVEREVVATTPPQVTYRITEKGRSLDDVVATLHRWGSDHARRA